MIVLDTHVWFWWINLEHRRLSAIMLDAISTSDRIGVSPVSCFELALAHKKGRLELPLPLGDWFRFALDGSDVELLPFDEAIAIRAVELSDIHRDPFDRIIIATALELNGRLASVDDRFGYYAELFEVLLK